MSKLVLLIVGAMWMAVLLPPLLRSRFDPGASSSVSDFRRQLNTLQRSQGPASPAHPMRAMARPLAQSPRQTSSRQPMRQAPTRPVQRPAAQSPSAGFPRPRLVPVDQYDEFDAPAPRARRSHHGAQAHPRHHLGAEANFMSPREVTRRRRVNALYGLVAANALTLFLGLTTGSTAMVYLFTIAFLGLGAYCYVLVQLRNQEYLRRYYGQRRAA